MKQKKISIVKIGFAFFLLALFVTAIKLYINERNAKNDVAVGTTSALNVSPTTTEYPAFHWDTYTNEEYGFSIKHPRLLYKQEYKNEGGYLFFVQFLETQYTEAKGLKIGVSKNSLENEATRTKKMLEEGEGILMSESEVLVNTMRGKRLEFKPMEEAGGELRPLAIVIVYDGVYSYSISSIPGQIDVIVDTFKVTDQTETNTNGSQFCGGIAGLPCPAGFTCKLDGEYPDAGGVCVKQ